MAGLLAAAVVVVGLSAAQPAVAATLRVPQDFSTIQQAEDNANPGDLIKIRRGTYDESVEVDESNVRFLGVDGRVIVDADNTGDDVFDIEADNVTLQNLTLRNGEGGGVECDGEACTMRSIGVDGDTVGFCIDLEGGDNHVVERSRVTGCSLPGVAATGDGVRLRFNTARLIGNDCYQVIGDNAVVQRNLAQSCEGAEGISLTGNLPRIDANVIRLAGTDGIDLGATQNPVVTRNLIQSVGEEGMFFNCFAACGSGLVQRNVVTGTVSGTAFNIGVADNVGTFRILNNTASRIAGEGFELSIFDALVRGNVANRVGATSGDGFDLEGSNNQLINNIALRGGDDGFVINGDSDDNTLRGNVAYRNQDEGLDINSTLADDNLFDRNRATRNSQDGIENGGTDTDLTDNRSSGNGGVDCITEPGGSVDLNTGNKCADGTSF